jgi:hypothetical protein
MSPYFSFLDSLFISISFIRSFYSFPAFISAFAAVSIILEIIKSLASWSDSAIPFYVLEKFDFSRSESRIISDLRFFFKVFISHKFRK